MYDPSDDTAPRRGGELSEAALSVLTERERTRVVAPLTEWNTLAAALRVEGIIRPLASPLDGATATTSVPAAVPLRRRGVTWVARSLAAASLFGVGVVAGTGLTAGRGIASTVARGVAIHDSTHVVRIGGEPGVGAGVVVANNGAAANAGLGATTFASADEARQVLARAQGAAQRAAAYLAVRDTGGGAQLVGDPEIYEERLAALDEMATAAQHALKDAPHDPVINQYYMSAVGARQAALQQLDRALPVGVQLKHY